MSIEFELATNEDTNVTYYYTNFKLQCYRSKPSIGNGVDNLRFLYFCPILALVEIMQGRISM